MALFQINRQPIKLLHSVEMTVWEGKVEVTVVGASFEVTVVGFRVVIYRSLSAMSAIFIRCLSRPVFKGLLP